MTSGSQTTAGVPGGDRQTAEQRMPTINLLVFDENAEFRSSLEHYTLSLPEVDYRALSSDVAGAIRTCAPWEPHIILYASELVKALGVDQFQAMRLHWPQALCYRLTVFDESVYDEFATGKGFDGSLPRAEIEEHLGRILRRLERSRNEESGA